MQQEAASRIASEEVFLDSLHSEESKKLLKEALTHCEELLVRNDLILENPSKTISEQAALMGEEIFHYAVEMLSEEVIMEDEELILPYEEDSDLLYKPVEEDETSDSDEYEFTKKKEIKGWIHPSGNEDQSTEVSQGTSNLVPGDTQEKRLAEFEEQGWSETLGKRHGKWRDSVRQIRCHWFMDLRSICRSPSRIHACKVLLLLLFIWSSLYYFYFFYSTFAHANRSDGKKITQLIFLHYG